ncbi:hypothetical protein LCGC14_3114440 [marine sediment metagenome]|uniref:Uncharacterized protein n=1 Tax=marine sediment metagenome TaxID=412755 RepID=A0A0F8WT47_9ZZZZ
MSQVQIKSLKEKHNYIIDWLLTNPGEFFGVLADEIKVSRSWLSIVMHSDVFVEEYTKRRLGHSKELSRQLIEKQLKIALKAYDKLELVLDDDDVEDRIILDTADKTAKLLGLTPSVGMAPQLLHEEVVIEREQVREVAPGVLERARERMRKTTTASFFGEERALPSPER